MGDGCRSRRRLVGRSCLLQRVTSLMLLVVQRQRVAGQGEVIML